MSDSGKESIGASTGRDESVIKRRQALFKQSLGDVDDMLANFPLYARRIIITRFLAHYELYKQVADLPGAVVELGVFRGSSLFSFAHFLEIFNHGDRSRKVIGFDSFEGLSALSASDGAEDAVHSKFKGGWNSSGFEGELYQMMDIFALESFVPQAPRIEIVKGNILNTVPDYIKQHPGLRISLLHFDCDVYEPTIVGLKSLVPLMVPGGLVVFDEYAITAWAGESAAVEEYFGKGKRIEKFPWTSTPGGFIRI